jgi:hypothetical protein
MRIRIDLDKFGINRSRVCLGNKISLLGDENPLLVCLGVKSLRDYKNRDHVNV